MGAARCGRPPSSATRCWRSIRQPTRSSASMSAARRTGSRSAIPPANCSPRSRPRTRSRWSTQVSRHLIGTIPIPHGAEGIAVSPDGATLFVCAHRKGVVHVIDAHSHALRRTLAIEGAPGEANQLRRVRVSPDGRYVCASSHVDNFAAVYDADTLKQIAGFATPKAPMGFGFAADGKHAYLCCHDAAITLEFESWPAAASRGNSRPRPAASSLFPIPEGASHEDISRRGGRGDRSPADAAAARRRP